MKKLIFIFLIFTPVLSFSKTYHFNDNIKKSYIIVNGKNEWYVNIESLKFFVKGPSFNQVKNNLYTYRAYTYSDSKANYGMKYECLKWDSEEINPDGKRDFEMFKVLISDDLFKKLGFSDKRNNFFTFETNEGKITLNGETFKTNIGAHHEFAFHVNDFKKLFNLVKNGGEVEFIINNIQIELPTMHINFDGFKEAYPLMNECSTKSKK